MLSSHLDAHELAVLTECADGGIVDAGDPAGIVQGARDRDSGAPVDLCRPTAIAQRPTERGQRGGRGGPDAAEEREREAPDQRDAHGAENIHHHDEPARDRRARGEGADGVGTDHPIGLQQRCLPTAVAVLDEVGDHDGADAVCVRGRELAAEDLHGCVVFGGRVGEGRVEGVASTAQPPIGEEVSEVGESASQVLPLAMRLRVAEQMGLREPGEHGEQIVGRAAVEQQRGDRGEQRMLRTHDTEHHRAGARQREVLSERALEPGHLARDGRTIIVGPRVFGLQLPLEVGHGVRSGEQLHHEIVQQLLVVADERRFGRGRLRHHHVIAVGSEMPLLHDGRSGDLIIDVAEELGVVLVLRLVVGRRQRRREPDQPRRSAALADPARQVGDDQGQ